MAKTWRKNCRKKFHLLFFPAPYTDRVRTQKQIARRHQVRHKERPDDPNNFFKAEPGIVYRIAEVCGTVVAPRAGFEPATNRLTAGCSTTELPGNEPMLRQRPYNKAKYLWKA